MFCLYFSHVNTECRCAVHHCHGTYIIYGVCATLHTYNKYIYICNTLTCVRNTRGFSSLLYSANTSVYINTILYTYTFRIVAAVIIPRNRIENRFLAAPLPRRFFSLVFPRYSDGALFTGTPRTRTEPRTKHVRPETARGTAEDRVLSILVGLDRG